METRNSGTSIKWSGSEIPTLYGIRGMAALDVVLSHLGMPGTDATYGVIWFFVLSGFLITHLLLREHESTGDISLRKFYARRALRIFPAFYGYAAVYVAGRLVMKLAIDWRSVVSCLTYTSNYYFAFSGHPLGTMIHTWSLAVEEQFYLLWPCIFLIFARNRRNLMNGLITTIIAIWAYRWVATAWAFNGTYVFGAFETRADALAIGCLLAIANREGKIPRWLIEWKWLSAVALVATAVSSFMVLNGPRYAWTLVAVAFAVILVQAVGNSHSRWFRWLDSRPLQALGVVSYSLYLYHPFANRLPAALHKMPLEVLFAIVLATASYWIVEKPFLLIKNRLYAPRSSAKSLPKKMVAL